MSAKRRLLMVGFGLSEPGTMGGNTKIALEAARHLCAWREVHIVLPEDSLYKKNEKPATASIMLILKPDTQLSKKEILKNILR